jgi:hypothetical protein
MFLGSWKDPVFSLFFYFFLLGRRASWPAYYDETSEALTTCIASLSPPFLLSGMDTLIYYCTRHIFLAHAAFYMLTCFNPSAEYEV